MSMARSVPPPHCPGQPVLAGLLLTDLRDFTVEERYTGNLKMCLMLPQKRAVALCNKTKVACSAIEVLLGNGNST